MNPLAEIAQSLVEQTLGGPMKEGWKTGEEMIGNIPVRWTSIECRSCGCQVYFDMLQYRHRCCNCGSGF